jgi:hypothetical protein
LQAIEEPMLEFLRQNVLAPQKVALLAQQRLFSRESILQFGGCPGISAPAVLIGNALAPSGTMKLGVGGWARNAHNLPSTTLAVRWANPEEPGVSALGGRSL